AGSRSGLPSEEREAAWQGHRLSSTDSVSGGTRARFNDFPIANPLHGSAHSSAPHRSSNFASFCLGNSTFLASSHTSSEFGFSFTAAHGKIQIRYPTSAPMLNQ